MDNNMYMINTVHFVGYRKFRYTVSMKLRKLCTFIFWATLVVNIIFNYICWFTNIGAGR